MKKITITITSFLLLLCAGSFAQEDKKEKIAKAVTDYFTLERENIHIHLDKNVFTIDESIWFKGYVFHRKKNVPFFSTINVFATLLDEEGKVVDSHLAYSNIGSFTGSFKLNKKIKSGRYYVQFYTNWMNNFSEDESFMYPVTIVNGSDATGLASSKPNYSKVNIDFRAEGGTLLQGVTNSIGISVSDCNRRPIPVTEADITDTAGKLIKKVQLNKLGFGKFDIPIAAGQAYKAVITIDGTKYEQALPPSQLKGVALEVNNYTVANKVIIKVRTNKFTDESLNDDPLYLVLHQDEKVSVFELEFGDSLDETIVLTDDELTDGVNSIRIIDSGMNQLAERLVFKYPTSVLTADVKKSGSKGEHHELSGKINYPNMNLSISVLPENSLALDETNDIYGSLLLSPYIDNDRKTSGKHYLSKLSKGKHYELDLFLLSQRGKYEWHNIKNNPPKSNYQFDMGLNLKGKLLTGDNRYAKVRLHSIETQLDELAEVDEKNEFYFNNLIIPDSAYVKFTLLKKGFEPKDVAIVPQLLNTKRKFYKNFRPVPYCPATAEALSDGNMPKIVDETIVLDEIKVEGKTLKYATSFGNSSMRGYKISQMDLNSSNTVVNYIQSRGGFNVVDNGSEVSITSRTRNSLNSAQATPAIYIDNIQIYDVAQLRIMRLDEVDEIYMAPHMIVPSVRNFQGVIKIYRNKNIRAKTRGGVAETVITNGFMQTEPFENAAYISTNDIGFENFGLIDWMPHIVTDETGEFKLNVAKTGQKSVKMLIEGFSADGKLFSEIKVLTLD
ncbi:MAG: hypothetical protein EOO45_08435 [Flavobacterium sp.]|nr:MAG: hypothetical protein EOO45_08435 [Flavobacterium sp.]